MSFIAAMIILGTYCSIEESVYNKNRSKPPCSWSKEFTDAHGEWAMKGWLIQEEKRQAQMQRQINFYKKLWRMLTFPFKKIRNGFIVLLHRKTEVKNEIVVNTDINNDGNIVCLDKKSLNVQDNSAELPKIRKFVRDSMRNLSEQNYIFSHDMLNKLIDGQETKIMFGTGLPFLKEVIDEANLSELIKDSKGYYRYWKEIFEFNGRKFIVNSQWTKHNADKFRNWYETLPNKQHSEKENILCT